jgi:HlyD family secretion protein
MRNVNGAMPMFVGAVAGAAWARRAAVVVVLALLAWGAWSMLRPEPLTVVVTPVQRGAMDVYVNADGVTRMRERVQVYAPSGGEVSRISLRAGDVVREGDVLARLAAPPPALLDPRTRAELEARVLSATDGLGQAQQGLERAEAALLLAQSEAERASHLLERGTGTAAAAESAEFALSAAEADVASARFAVRVARHSRQQVNATLAVDEDAERTSMDITSPIDGVVLQVFQTNAGMVTPGTPLLELGDPTVIEGVVGVLTADAVRLRTGARARLTRWGGSDALLGRISRIEPLAYTRISALGVEEQRVNVLVDLPNLPEGPEAIGDGWRIEAALAAWHADDVVQVPLNAVFRHEDGWAVWTVDGTTLAITPVSLGQRNERLAEVTEGLEPGQQVVMHPSEALTVGATVVPVLDSTATAIAPARSAVVEGPAVPDGSAGDGSGEPDSGGEGSSAAGSGAR